MKKTTLILVSILSTFAGMLLNQQLMSKSPVPGESIYFSTLAPDQAHTYSVKYRNTANYCGINNGSNKEGIFDISELTIDGLSAAVEQIKSSNGGKVPASYRCIFGEDESGETIIMVVGLDQNRYEYQNASYMYKIAGTLPCPTLCDLSKSSIVMGDPKRGQNSCN
jgi:hypothetical protein